MMGKYDFEILVFLIGILLVGLLLGFLTGSIYGRAFTRDQCLHTAMEMGMAEYNPKKKMLVGDDVASRLCQVEK